MAHVQPMTSREMGLELVELLSPLLYGSMFKVSNGEQPPLAGISDHVMVTWANVPDTAPELDALNAQKQIMLSIEAPEWEQRRVDRSMIGRIPVSKVKVHAFRGNSRSFRGKTGTPQQVIMHIVKWFHEHAGASAQSMGIATKRLGRSNMAGGNKRYEGLTELLDTAENRLNNGNDWRGEYRDFHLWIGAPSGSRTGQYEGQIQRGGHAISFRSRSFPAIKKMFTKYIGQVD